VAAVAVGDLSAIAGVACVAAEVDALGRFGAVIHNAGAFDHDAKPLVTEEGRRATSPSTHSRPMS
jgi:hypothetical protein